MNKKTKTKPLQPKIFCYLNKIKHNTLGFRNDVFKKMLIDECSIIKHSYLFNIPNKEESILSIMFKDDITEDIFLKVITYLQKHFKDENIIFYYKSHKEVDIKYTYTNIKKIKMPVDDVDFRSDSD